MPTETANPICLENSAAQKFSAQPERRKSRRTTVPLRVRMRPANPGDTTFEEIATTVNATTAAFYIHTNLDHYSEGLQVRVNFPFTAGAGLPDLERRGEVIRVDRRSTGCGVAVKLLPIAIGTSQSDPDLIPLASPALSDEPLNERRLVQRTPFVAPVYLRYEGSNARIQARCSDLSLCGCFVDTLNPFPVGTIVNLEIVKGDTALQAQATVCSEIERMGMGLFFNDMAADQLAILESWLPQSGSESPLALSDSVQSATTKDLTGQKGTFEAALLRILDRKGILSPSEVAELREYLKS